MLQEYPESPKIIGVKQNRHLPTARKLSSAVLTSGLVPVLRKTYVSKKLLKYHVVNAIKRQLHHASNV
jgi:hypothetical protein